MQWHRLNILIDRLAHEQDEMGVFHVKTDGTIISTQNGVFRTNCVDCLDRTNVVQSMLAKRSLQQILEKLNIVRIGQKVETITALDALFKNVWADNADLISIQYSGTGALKTDFTRTGKRTVQGMFQDGVNSLTRYFKNNFNDGFRQVPCTTFMFHIQFSLFIPLVSMFNFVHRTQFICSLAIMRFKMVKENCYHARWK